MAALARASQAAPVCCVINFDESDSGGLIRIAANYTAGGPPVSALIYDATITYKKPADDASRAFAVQEVINQLPLWGARLVGKTTVLVWSTREQELLSCDVVQNTTTLVVETEAFVPPFGILDFDATLQDSPLMERASTGGPFDFRVGATDFTLSGAAVTGTSDSDVRLEAQGAIQAAFQSATLSPVGNTALVIAGEPVSSCSSGDGNVSLGCHTATHGGVPSLSGPGAAVLALLLCGWALVSIRRR